MHPMNVLYAAMVENQAERNRWMKIKDYADQVSVLTSVAVERFLTPWEEQRVKELVLAMLEELRAERRGGHNLPPQPMPLPRPLDTSSLLIDPRMDLAALAPRLHHHPAPPSAPPHLSQHFHQPLPPIASVAEVPPPRKRGRKPLNRGEQCCMSCKTTNTPEWRKGPDGRNSLCNACGLRWSKASRPAAAAAEEEEDSSHEQQRQQQQLSFESHPSVASIAAMAPTSVAALISTGERFEDESGEHRGTTQQDEPRTREDLQTEDHHIDDGNNNDEDRTVKKESP